MFWVLLTYPLATLAGGTVDSLGNLEVLHTSGSQLLLGNLDGGVEIQFDVLLWFFLNILTLPFLSPLVLIIIVVLLLFPLLLIVDRLLLGFAIGVPFDISDTVQVRLVHLLVQLSRSRRPVP